MGWRFRRSIRFGGFRINLSRTGVGFSSGVGPIRTGLGADGRRYVSLNIPGTGITWMKYFSRKVLPPSQTPNPAVLTQPSTQQKAKGGAPSAQKSSPIPWWKQKNLP